LYVTERIYTIEHSVQKQGPR